MQAPQAIPLAPYMSYYLPRLLAKPQIKECVSVTTLNK